MTEREINVLNNITGVIKKYLNPERIILFGSRVRKNCNKNADFDLAIENEKTDFRTERKILNEIEKVSGLYKVDLAYLNKVDKEFKKIILSTGKLIYERNS